MSGSEFKTDSEVKTSSKYATSTKYPSGGELSFSDKEKESLYENLDQLSYQDLKVIKKHERVKTKATSKAGLKKAIKRHLESERPKESEFKQDLKQEYDQMSAERRGSMVRIPDLYREMEKEGYSEKEFKEGLLQLEKERAIELQVASDPKTIPEGDKKLGISHKTRGHLNYVVWRKPVKRREVKEVDKRGFRGNHAENQVIDAYQKEGWKVAERPSKGHDIVVKKRRWEKYYDVKEVNESVDSGKGIEKGRVQIDQKELQRIKDWEKGSKSRKALIVIKINKDNGKDEWKQLTLEKAYQLMKGKKDPVKIPYSEIKFLPDFKDVKLPKQESLTGSRVLTGGPSESKIQETSPAKEEMSEYLKEAQRTVETAEKIEPMEFRNLKETDGLDLSVQPVREKDYTEKGKIKELRNGKVVIDKKGPKIEERNFKRVWVVEKEDTAKRIQEAFPNDVVHTLSGNPFDQPKTTHYSKNNRVRVSKDSTIAWRNDRSFGRYFYYPKVSKNQKVVIVTDEDYLGQYINREVAKSINSQNVLQYAIEGMKASEFRDLVKNPSAQKEHRFSDAKAYAQEWFVEADSTVNTTILSNMVAKGSFFAKHYDNIVKDAYGEDFTQFKRASSLSQGVSMGRIEMGIGNYVLGKQVSQDVKAEIIMDTEIGIQTIETSLKKPPRGDFNVKFEAEEDGIRDLKILSTDETIQYLINNLKISGVQAEELINRLYRQGYLSYPRTESNRINLRKEETNAEDLAKVWNSYLDAKYDEKQIAKGIHELNTSKGKSGIVVLRKSPYKESDLEHQVLLNIARLNTLATTKAKEVDGKFVLEDEKGRVDSSSVVSLINTEEFGKDVGKVVDVKILTDSGVSEIDLYRFLHSNEIGTPSTRTNKLDSMLKSGFLVRRKNRYLVDERLKFFIIENKIRNKYAQMRYTKTPEFDYHLTEAMYQLRSEVEKSKDPNIYSNSYQEVQRWLRAQFNPYEPLVVEEILGEIREALKQTKQKTSIDQEFEELQDDRVEIDEESS